MNAGGSNARLKNEAKYFALEYKKLIVSSISDAALDYAINLASEELEKEISLLGTRYKFKRNKTYFFILHNVPFSKSLCLHCIQISESSFFQATFDCLDVNIESRKYPGSYGKEYNHGRESKSR